MKSLFTVLLLAVVSLAPAWAYGQGEPATSRAQEPLAPVKLVKANGIIVGYGLGKTTAAGRGAALTAAAAAMGAGDMLVLGPGEFTGTTPIRLTDNQSLIGQGDLTKLDFTSAAQTGHCIRLHGDNITVRGIYLVNPSGRGVGCDGGEASLPGGFDGPQNAVIENYRFSGLRGAIGFFPTSLPGGTAVSYLIRNVQIVTSGATGQAIYAAMGGSTSAGVISDALVDAADGGAYGFLTTAGSRVTLLGGRIHDTSGQHFNVSGGGVVAVEGTVYDASKVTGAITREPLFGVTMGAGFASLIDDADAAAIRNTAGATGGEFPDAAISNSLTLTGGALTGVTLNNSVIGGVTPAAGSFTTVTAATVTATTSLSTARIILPQATVTSSAPLISGAQVWNGSSIFEGDSLSFSPGATTPSASSTVFSRLWNGVPVISVTRAGNTTVAGWLTVADDAYNSSLWDGNLQVPTKNAIRDKIESLTLGAGLGTATYITRTPASELDNETALSTLSTGLLSSTTGTGVVQTVTTSAGIAAPLSDETGTGALVFNTSPTFSVGVTINGGVALSNSGIATWTGRARIEAPSSGILSLQDGSGASLGTLRCGTSSSVETSTLKLYDAVNGGYATLAINASDLVFTGLGESSAFVADDCRIGSGEFDVLLATPAANTTPFSITGYSLTGASAASAVNVAGTWNTTGAPTAVKVNMTDTASNSASLLLDLQRGGASQFKVGKLGVVTTKQGVFNNGNVSTSSPVLALTQNWLTDGDVYHAFTVEAGTSGSGTPDSTVMRATRNGTEYFAVRSEGTLYTSAGLLTSATGFMRFNGRSRLTSAADGSLTLANDAGSQSATVSVGASNLLSTNGGFTAAGAIKTNKANVGGSLTGLPSVTPVGNVGGGDDTILNYTIPAGTLSTNGDVATFKVVVTSTAAESGTLDFYFAGNALSPQHDMTTNGNWIIELEIVRLSNTSAAVTYTWVNPMDDYRYSRATVISSGIDFSAGVVVHSIGEDTSTTPVTNAIQQIYVRGEYQPAN